MFKRLFDSRKDYLLQKVNIRLQGFPDEMFDTAIDLGLADTHLYKMAGNAVTVNVIESVARKLAEVINDST